MSELAENIDDVLASAAASLVNNFLGESLLNKSRDSSERSVDSVACRDCASPGSVSIITLSSDSGEESGEEEAFGEGQAYGAEAAARFGREQEGDGDQEDFFTDSARMDRFEGVNAAAMAEISHKQSRGIWY